MGRPRGTSLAAASRGAGSRTSARVRAATLLAATFALADGAAAQSASEVDRPTPEPIAGASAPAEAWTDLLADGGFAAWTPKIRSWAAGEDPLRTFRMEGDVLQVRYDGYHGVFGERFGHLFTASPYAHYRLSLEYRFVGRGLSDTPGWAILNSGVMVHAQDPVTMPPDQDFPISVEVQFLAELEPGSPRPTANLCTPGTHVVLGGALDERHCVNSTSPTLPPHRWVRVDVEVLGHERVRHFVDGELVLEYGAPVVGGGVVNGFDPAVKVDGTPLGSGFIALQAEGQELDFRNVRILELSPAGGTTGGGIGR